MAESKFSHSIFASLDDFLEHCQKRLQSSATVLFANLDKDFNPYVYIVGLDRFGADNNVHIAPPSFPNFFTRVANQFFEFAQQGEQSLTHQTETSEILKSTLARSLIQTMSKNLEAYDHAPFVAEPISIDDYIIVIVLVLKLKVWESHYLLSRRLEGVRSLPDAAVNLFLLEARNIVNKLRESMALLKPVHVSDYELLRNAGQGVLAKVLYDLQIFKSGDKAPSTEWFLKTGMFFYDLNRVSQTSYEHVTAKGQILLCHKHHQNVDVLVEFDSPVKTIEHRAFRKLLEMSGGGLYLLWDEGEVFGLGKQKGKYHPQSEDLYTIEISGHYTWSLSNGLHTLMEVKYEKPRLPQKEGDYISVMRHSLESEFNQLEASAVNELVALILIAKEQSHGTMLVITEQAKSESKRLATQSTRIKPTTITPEVMKQITAIDGAVILGIDKKCYGIGAILDGTLKEGEGNPSRGARYNSAIKYMRYSREHKHKCVVVVISADGMIDVFWGSQEKNTSPT